MSNFELFETVILTDKAAKGLPMRVGLLAKVIEILHTSVNYDYDVQFSDGEITPVRECELIKLTNKDEEYLEYIFKGNKAKYHDQEVTIVKTDYFHYKAEILIGEVEDVVDFKELQPIHINFLEENKLGYFAELGLSIGKLVDKKQKAYGDSVTKCHEIMKVLLSDYHNKEEHTYTFPESLLPQMLLDIRKIDKMNRRFSNPDGDLMGENPYQDDTGYDMLGVRLVEQMKKDGQND
jgi:hypothetical protein